jgi:copper chaperone CopZ
MKKFFSILALALFLSASGAFAEDVPGPQTLNLEVKGMNCPMCAAKIENSIKKLGVIECKVDDKTGKGVVKYDPSKVTPDQIIETCNKSGFKCQKI